LLASTLESPLKRITEEFLLESFLIQLAAAGEDTDIPTLVREMVSLTFQVTALHSPRKSKNDSFRGLRRGLRTTEYLDFYAEFVCTIGFVEPSDPTTKPPNNFIFALYGDWMNKSFFGEDQEVLKQMFADSEVPSLQQMRGLTIGTNVEIGQNPFRWSGGSENYNGQTSSRSSSSHKGLVAALVIVSTATFVAAALFAKPFFVKKLSPDGGAFPMPDDPRLSLPGRHGDAAEILEASDRYLSQHRPDLFAALYKGTSSMASLVSLRVYGTKELEYTGRSVGSSPPPEKSNWWTKLTTSVLSGNRYQAHFSGNLACDEDPRKYPFAFQDFPRQDGTPCLIYSENDQDASTPTTLRGGSMACS
jgi:hypothetical protein